MPIDLIAKRLERLERTQRESNALLERLVRVLEVHSTHFERIDRSPIGGLLGDRENFELAGGTCIAGSERYYPALGCGGRQSS